MRILFFAIPILILSAISYKALTHQSTQNIHFNTAPSMVQPLVVSHIPLKQPKVITTKRKQWDSYLEFLGHARSFETFSKPISLARYLEFKPETTELDELLSEQIFKEAADYQKFYFLENKGAFSVFLYRYDKDDHTTIHLTTIDNETIELIDNILLEERDIFENEVVGTTSLQVGTSSFFTTFYEKGMDYEDIRIWENDEFKIEYDINEDGTINEHYSDEHWDS